MFYPTPLIGIMVAICNKRGRCIAIGCVLYNGNNDNDDDIKMFIVESFD